MLKLLTLAGLVVASLAGNGAPSGKHYNLNLIGVPKAKTASMTGNNGHRIFIYLEGKSKILLQEGPDFQVLDGNGMDGPAKFQLPDPSPGDGNGLIYLVWIRPVAGKGKISMDTCYTDKTTGEEWCTAGIVDATKSKSFTDVIKELLTLCVTDDGGDTFHREALFDDSNYEYFWETDNQGMRLTQLRFYPISTTSYSEWYNNPCAGKTKGPRELEGAEVVAADSMATIDSGSSSITWGMATISALLGVMSFLLVGHVYMLHKLTKSVTAACGGEDFHGLPN
jgi:hypothetical protein